MLVLKLYFGIDFKVAYDHRGKDTFFGKDVLIEDTMVLAKTLNPDRFGGASLDNLSKSFADGKIDFRPKFPRNNKFDFFGADMLYYCIRDVDVNTRVRRKLIRERDEDGGLKIWSNAYAMEKKVAEIITCLLYTSPSPRDGLLSRMPSSA